MTVTFTVPRSYVGELAALVGIIVNRHDHQALILDPNFTDCLPALVDLISAAAVVYADIAATDGLSMTGAVEAMAREERQRAERVNEVIKRLTRGEQ